MLSEDLLLFPSTVYGSVAQLFGKEVRGKLYTQKGNSNLDRLMIYVTFILLK